MSFRYVFNTELPGTPQTKTKPNLAAPNTGLSKEANFGIKTSISSIVRANRIVNQLQADPEGQAWIITEIFAGLVDEIAIPTVLKFTTTSISEKAILKTAKTFGISTGDITHYGSSLNQVDEFVRENIITTSEEIAFGGLAVELLEDDLKNLKKIKSKLSTARAANKIVPIAATIGIQGALSYATKQREIYIINRQIQYSASFKGSAINKR